MRLRQLSRGTLAVRAALLLSLPAQAQTSADWAAYDEVFESGAQHAQWWDAGWTGIYAASLAFDAYQSRKAYGFLIGAIFSGVIGVGFYPIFGSRVWCRFGCPMAAILGFQQRLLSKFRITTNGGQCISCGNCSTYCEMGIDVRAYAQKGENIVRSSCVGCGICSAVCPRGVLKLENDSMNGRINSNDILLGNDVNLMDYLKQHN